MRFKEREKNVLHHKNGQKGNCEEMSEQMQCVNVSESISNYARSFFFFTFRIVNATKLETGELNGIEC